MRDLRRPDRGLQIVVRLRSGAAGLEHIGQRRQAEFKTRFRACCTVCAFFRLASAASSCPLAFSTR